MKMIRAISGILFLFLAIYPVHAQVQKTSPSTYLLFLTDKKGSAYSLSQPEKFLTQRSIDRRQKQHIALDSTDLPVSKLYLDSLSRMGFPIHNISKWLNSVTVKTSDTLLLRKLQNISFIKQTTQASPLMFSLSSFTEPFAFQSSYDSAFYGLSYKQIHLHNGEYLHNKGFMGEGKLIAIIDAGFNNYLSMTAFKKVREEGRITAVKDFVAHDGEVNSDHSHGANVFSIIASDIADDFMGTAPKASFLLLRSEDATNDIFGKQSEYVVEEDNWVSAAEFADSLGADVINTSLGYTEFNDPLENHTYANMNGSATRISKAAEMAALKGMISVISAGNEGANSWRHISAPADAMDVLSVGAVNVNKVRAYFSSMGPTADKRIKPDVMAMGQGTYLQNTANQIVQGSGTSFSAPVIAGLTACLWQGAGNKTNFEVMDAIRKFSDNAAAPDSLYGYGIPDFKKALLFLNPEIFQNKGKLTIYPNPCRTNFSIEHEALPVNSVRLEIFNTTGAEIFNQSYAIEINMVGTIQITGLPASAHGILYARFLAGNKVLTGTIVKL